jgi:uncharacterized protein (DUF2147 family)
MNWTAYLGQNPALQTYWNNLTPAQKAQFNNDPARFGEWHWNTQGQQGGFTAPPQAPAPAPGPQQVMDQIDAGPLAQFARSDLDQRNALVYGQSLDDQTLNANAYNDLNAEAGSAYGDRNALITNEVNAWDQVAQREAEDARNLVASRFGVRGDLGKSTRNIAEIGNRYAQDRALYEGGKRYSAYDDLAQRREANLGAYHLNASTNNNRMWQGYGSAYDAYSGGKASAYSDWLNARNRQSDTGYNASQLAVNAGQVATNNINSANQNAADAYSNAALARGNANANMWNQIGSAAGNAYGSWSNRKQPAQAQPRYDYKSYGTDQYGSWYG